MQWLDILIFRAYLLLLYPLQSVIAFLKTSCIKSSTLGEGTNDEIIQRSIDKPKTCMDDLIALHPI